VNPSVGGDKGPRILVIRCGAVGDTVMATCVIDPILARFPDAQIEWLATPGSAALFKHDPRMTQVHLLRHRKFPTWLTKTKRELVRSSRKRPFDWIVNLEVARFLRPFVSALKCRHLIGFNDALPWQDIHGVDNHRRVLAAGGFDLELAYPSLRGIAPSITLPPRFVVLHPGNSHAVGRGRLNIRAWPEERWRALLLALHSKGIAVAVTGAPTEAELVRKVAGREGIDLAGRTTLPELIDVVGRAVVFVSSDTGPIHIAAATGVPILGLYGPTRPSQTRPYGREGQVLLLHSDRPCIPCYGTPQQISCADNLCMSDLGVDLVLERVLERWDGR